MRPSIATMMSVPKDDAIIYRPRFSVSSAHYPTYSSMSAPSENGSKGTMKRKRIKRDRESSGRGLAPIPESARRLRELYARGMAELEERRKLDPNVR
jgi:hypothetical protein